MLQALQGSASSELGPVGTLLSRVVAVKESLG